ncbi:MAG TPA: circadian clock protein KaiC [Candidatus Limnocylindrales bacterium]|nr:circadian clock protein KaiC [Candidatus Limnocylindrales bacterium]
MNKKQNLANASATLPKAMTGIQGLDEVTEGGLPKGRPTLICGGPGCGKTLFGIEFLVRGATEFNEPGVFMAFEETPEELIQNVKSLGFDLESLVKQKKLYLSYVKVERSEIEETGEYDLEGLFIRLSHAIDSIGAKRVVLDTLESLFSGLDNTAILRAELRRLFRWLKDKGVTAVITGEQGTGQLTRQGLEEYVSDCVILLDHRVRDQITTRRLRIVKYRGTTHGTNEYPYLIDKEGFVVLPITSLKLNHDVSSERVSSGIERLDAMLGGKGYYKGSTILASGTAGTGKTSIASHFANAACNRGDRCIYFAFEESPKQIIRNMKSINVDLEKWEKKELLKFHASRPTLQGLEMHLVTMYKMINEFKPDVVIIDPLTSLISAGTTNDVKAMLTRIIDFLKMHQITSLFTALVHGQETSEHTNEAISSLVDTWLLVRDVELNGERNRAIHVLKSRGMPHSNQVREFLVTAEGIDLIDVYMGTGGMLTGSARVAQEMKDKDSEIGKKHKIELKKRELLQKRQAIEQQIENLRSEIESDEQEMTDALATEEATGRKVVSDKQGMARARKADKNFDDIFSQVKKSKV